MMAKITVLKVIYFPIFAPDFEYVRNQRKQLFTLQK
jgi:hypothetical protein